MPIRRHRLGNRQRPAQPRHLVQVLVCPPHDIERMKRQMHKRPMPRQQRRDRRHHLILRPLDVDLQQRLRTHPNLVQHIRRRPNRHHRLLPPAQHRPAQHRPALHHLEQARPRIRPRLAVQRQPSIPCPHRMPMQPDPLRQPRIHRQVRLQQRPIPRTRLKHLHPRALRRRVQRCEPHEPAKIYHPATLRQHRVEELQRAFLKPAGEFARRRPPRRRIRDIEPHPARCDRKRGHHRWRRQHHGIGKGGRCGHRQASPAKVPHRAAKSVNGWLIPCRIDRAATTPARLQCPSGFAAGLRRNARQDRIEFSRHRIQPRHPIRRKHRARPPP